MQKKKEDGRERIEREMKDTISLPFPVKPFPDAFDILLAEWKMHAHRDPALTSGKELGF